MEVRQVFLHTRISGGERRWAQKKIPVAGLPEPAKAIEEALHNAGSGVTGVTVDENFPTRVKEVHLDNIEVSRMATEAAHSAALRYGLEWTGVRRNRESKFDLDLVFEPHSANPGFYPSNLP